MDINVTAPYWLVGFVPSKDPHFPSNIAVSDYASSGISEIELLKNWCQQSANAFVRNIWLAEAGVDIIITDRLDELIERDKEISDCFSKKKWPHIPSVISQTIAFDGVVPISRAKVGGGLGAVGLYRLFAGLTDTERTKSAAAAPKELVSVSSSKVQCTCVDGDEARWRKLLLDGWLLNDPSHCLAKPEGYPRVSCAGTREEVNLNAEVELFSLGVGTIETHEVPKDPSQFTFGELNRVDHYCYISEELHCTPLNTISFANRETMIRWFTRWCRLAGNSLNICTKKQPIVGDYVDLENTASRISSQRKDLMEGQGTGVFAVPLRALFFELGGAIHGEYKTNLLGNERTSSNEFRPLYIALQSREKNNDFKIIANDENMEAAGKIDIEALFLGRTPYTRRISVITPVEYMGNIPINSYLRMLQGEWKPNITNSYSLVSLSELQ